MFLNASFPWLAVGVTFAAWARATVIAPPAVMGGSTPYSGSYPITAAVDGTPAEFASAGAGAATFLDFDFGAVQTIHRVVAINRDTSAPGDRFARVTFIFSDDPFFEAGDATETFDTPTQRGHGGLHALSTPRAARHVRFDVDTLAGTGAYNTGAMELFFLQTPPGTREVAGVSVIASSPAFSVDYAAANSVNGVLGVSASPGGIEYASAGAGTSGATRPPERRRHRSRTPRSRTPQPSRSSPTSTARASSVEP